MSVYNDLYVEGNHVVKGSLTADTIDTTTATTMVLGSSTATKVEIAKTGVLTEIKGTSNISGVAEFKNYIQLNDIIAPGNPANGQGRLYKKTGSAGLYWKPNLAGSEYDLTSGGGGGGSSTYTRTSVTNIMSPYTVLISDEIVGIDTTGGMVTVILPQISSIGGDNNYKRFYIVDEGGNASSNNITVNTTGGDTINKQVSPMLINVSHTSISLYNNGINNWVIF